MSPVVKKKHKNFSISGQTLLLILTGVCALLLVLSFNTTIFEGALKGIAGYIVVPFQKGIAEVGVIFQTAPKSWRS